MKGKDAMKTAVWMPVVLLVVVTMGFVQAATEKSPMVLFQEALYQEETEGDLDKAIELYQQVLEQAAEVERVAARTTYQLGMCHLKKGEKTTAANYFRKAVNSYPKQTSVVKKAKSQLEKIVPQEAGGRLIRHSFEDANRWEKGQSVDGVSYIWDKNAGSDGKRSLCLKKDVDKYFPIAQWTRNIQYTGNAKELTVSAQVRAKKAYKAIIDALFLDDKGEWIKHEWVSYIGAKEKNDPPANHNWKKYAGAVEIPENTKTIVIGLQMYGPGTVWFDEIEVAYVSQELANIVEKAILTISTCAETDPRVKKSLDTLKNLDEQRVASELSSYLDSETQTIRRSAIYILWRGGLSDISAAQQKLLELCGHAESYTRGMAALALGEYKIAAAYDALVEMTLQDKDGYARRCGAYALGLLGDRKALPVLKKALGDPEDLVKGNAQAAITMLTKLNGEAGEDSEPDATMTQEMHNDIQSDGTIRFRNPEQIVNNGNKPITERRFINSDFVQLTAMTDENDNPVEFTSKHENSIYHYHVIFDPPVKPGETFNYYSEGTITGLVKPVANQEDTYRYYMTHSPASGVPTLRIEEYVLPEGAELISTMSDDMVRSEKNGRIVLRVKKVILAGGKLTTSFKYKLVK